MRLNFRRNAWTVVADLHDHAIVLAISAHAKFAFAAHRVDRVVDQVRPNLIQFAAKGIHQQRDLLIIALHSDSVS